MINWIMDITYIRTRFCQKHFWKRTKYSEWIKVNFWVENLLSFFTYSFSSVGYIRSGKKLFFLNIIGSSIISVTAYDFRHNGIGWHPHSQNCSFPLIEQALYIRRTGHTWENTERDRRSVLDEDVMIDRGANIQQVNYNDQWPL